MPYSGPEVTKTHHYQRAPGRWLTAAPCAICDMPKINRVHDVPPTPKAAQEIDARVLGEDPDQS